MGRAKEGEGGGLASGAARVGPTAEREGFERATGEGGGTEEGGGVFLGEQTERKGDAMGGAETRERAAVGGEEEREGAPAAAEDAGGNVADR